MKTVFAVTLAVLAPLGILRVLSHAQEKAADSDFLLPADPAAVVISLDYRGGLPPPFPRKNNEPYLVIQAGGKAIVNDPFERKPRVEAKLSLKEVQELLAFAIRDHDFFALDSGKIKAAIEGQLKKGHVTDLPTTFLRIKTAGREHEVHCYALFVYAERFPTIKPLAQLHAIERRLAEVMDKLRSATANADAAPVLKAPPPRPTASVLVPDLFGLTYKEAKSVLAAKGLALKATPSKGADVVHRQSPAAGTSVKRGSLVIAYMGAPLVVVPEVVGMPYAEARSVLEQAGFLVKAMGDTKYRVKIQKPAAGTKVIPGSTVTLRLGPVVLTREDQGHFARPCGARVM